MGRLEKSSYRTATMAPRSSSNKTDTVITCANDQLKRGSCIAVQPAVWKNARYQHVLLRQPPQQRIRIIISIKHDNPPPRTTAITLQKREKQAKNKDLSLIFHSARFSATVRLILGCEQPGRGLDQMCVDVLCTVLYMRYVARISAWGQCCFFLESAASAVHISFCLPLPTLLLLLPSPPPTASAVVGPADVAKEQDESVQMGLPECPSFFLFILRQ